MMRYKLWKYTDNYGYPDFALEDTQGNILEKTSWYKQDVSIYDEDNGKLVWKRATHQRDVEEFARTGKVVAQSDELKHIKSGRE